MWKIQALDNWHMLQGNEDTAEDNYMPNTLARSILVRWQRGIWFVLYIKVRGIITRPPIYQVWIDMSMVT